LKKIFACLLILTNIACLQAQNKYFKKISSRDAYHLIKKNRNNKNFVILDIRTKPEYDSGHLENSVLIDYYAADFRKNLSKLKRTKTYLVYCRTGNRSGRAMQIFSQLGFEKIYDMHDGIAGWHMADLPVVK
jgi:rhodanese-related sulfurtransferase